LILRFLEHVVSINLGNFAHKQVIIKTKTIEDKKLSSQVLERNARLLKSRVAIEYGKYSSVKASAEIVKIYSMDSLSPAVTDAGKQSFEWCCERFYTDQTYFGLLLATGATLQE
jgi:hypothetical protein